jgi:cytoskeletal protein RodZ
VAERLGDILATARRSLGKTLGEAEAATKIRGKLLEALEHGEYSALPNVAYVKGYVIGYAKYLELDPGPLLKLLAEETGHSAHREQIRVPEQVVPTRKEAQTIPWSAILAVAAVVVVIALAVWGVGRLLSGPQEPLPIPVTPASTNGQSGEDTQTAPIVEPTSTAQPDEEAGVGEPFMLKVEVASDAASWLRVTVDGLKAYEGTLSGGGSKEWEVTDEAVVRIGKPSAVTVYRDGTPVEIPPAAETPEMTLSTSDTTE